jgi:phosphohistidine phosphatase
MSMDVIIVRHAAALDRDEARSCGMLDRDRPLTKQGKARMRRAARGIASRTPELWTVLTSPLRRATETAEILREQYKAVRQVETEALEPEQGPAALAELLGGGAFESPVAVVGHEPYLSSWVSWGLTGDTRGLIQLRKGGACLLRFDGAPGPSQGRLLWLLPPSILRRL